MPEEKEKTLNEGLLEKEGGGADVPPPIVDDATESDILPAEEGEEITTSTEEKPPEPPESVIEAEADEEVVPVPEEKLPAAAEKEAMAGVGSEPVDVRDISWKRNVERISFLEKFGGGIKAIWRSKFTMMLLAVIVAGILFGLDIGSRMWGYATIHCGLVLFLGRCIYLQFTTKEEEDEIYSRLTKQKG